MTQEQLFKKVDEIRVMGYEQLDAFASAVHSAVGLDGAVKKILLETIDERKVKLEGIADSVVVDGDIDDVDC